MPFIGLINNYVISKIGPINLINNYIISGRPTVQFDLIIFGGLGRILFKIQSAYKYGPYDFLTTNFHNYFTNKEISK